MRKNRMESFSDCVFSIVATLLVLELKVPEAHTVWRSLALMSPKIVAFVLSFVVVSMYWVAHHAVFDFVDKVDRNLLWLNNLSLMCISFIPFPTAVIGSHPLEPGAITLYACTLILVNVMNTLAWRYAAKTPGLANDRMTDSMVNRGPLLHLAPAGFYLVAIAISPWVPWISIAIFLCVPLFFIVPNPLFKKLVYGWVANR